MRGRQKFGAGGKSAQLLDHYTRERIILVGLIAVVLLTLLIHSALMKPLKQKTDAGLDEKNSLEQAVQLLESQRDARAGMIPPGSELPDALDHLQECLNAQGLAVEEILINQLSSVLSGSFTQAVIRVTVSGERLMVLESLTKIVNLQSYPFLVEEIDIQPAKTVIYLKILLR